MAKEKKTKKNISIRHKYGWIRQKKDKRDYVLSRPRIAKADLPVTVDLRDKMPPIFDQGPLGSCSAQAWSAAFKYALTKGGDMSAFIPSRLFIYYGARVIIDTVNEDSGAILRDGAKTLAKDGVCDEMEWEYDIKKFTIKPNDTCYEHALEHQALTYWTVPQDLKSIQACLAEGFPIVLGIIVFESIESEEVSKTGILEMPKRGERRIGGHAVLLVGYNNETKRFIMRNSWGCYDENTEVLTKDGFKFFKDLYESDKFATLNRDGGLMYEHASDFIVKRYKGVMHHYEDSKIDLLVTPNHNMYISSKHKKDKFKFVESQNITSKRFLVKRDVKWIGEEKEFFNMPSYEHFNNGSEKSRVIIESKNIEMDKFLEFLGYFLSEGSLSRSICKRGGFQYNIKITQTKRASAKKIQDLLNELGYSFSYNGKDFSISNKQLFLYLRDFGLCDKKYIPRDLLELSPRQLRILFDALMLGDGSITKSRTGLRYTYYTASRQLKDDFQELCLRLGFTSSVNVDDRVGEISSNGYRYNFVSYQIKIQNVDVQNRSKEHMVENDKGSVDYDGNVYCVTVPNHTLFIRRNGKTCWCGNSNWGDNGNFTIPYDYILNPRLASDFWTLRLVEMDKKA
jgi:C1A family cysteine protease